METTSVWLLGYLKPAMKTGWAVTSQNWVINEHPITYCGHCTPQSSSCFGCAGLQLTPGTCFVDGAEELWRIWRILVEVIRGSNGFASSSSDGAGVPKKKSWPNDWWAESFGEHPQNENVVFSFARPPLLWSKVAKPSNHLLLHLQALKCITTGL